ncbi:YraN family protein [Candidatus Saccharibacteria bacterium]|nr:YraN family protein [Candidatus Saccharibacteria bacterium]
MAIHNLLGAAAEDEVKKFLSKNRYKILDSNWKTKWCEIDIVAKKDKVIHFVEVKYRNSSSQGSGFDYINSKKLTQMARAADSWVAINKWDGEYVLSAAEVSGDNFKIEFIAEI